MSDFQTYGCARRLSESLAGAPVYTESEIRVGVRVLDDDSLPAIERELRIAVAELLDTIRRDRASRG